MPDQTMRAVRFHDYGPPEALVVERVPRPEPGEGEVLVRVHAAGVNPVDWKFRRGDMRNFRPLQLPSAAGIDLAGTVEAVGPGVTAWQVGQAVFGSGSGAYAEYAVAPAGNLAAMPRTLTFDQAAAAPIGARTAWTALFDAAGLQPGQRLLVNGAAGGVGHFAVQLGRWKGAHVIGTASAANVDFVRSLGAETVVDYAATSVEDAVRDVDAVLDTVGGAGTERLLRVVKPGGVIASIAGPVPEEVAQQRGGARGACLAAALAWCAAPAHRRTDRVGNGGAGGREGVPTGGGQPGARAQRDRPRAGPHRPAHRRLARPRQRVVCRPVCRNQ